MEKAPKELPLLFLVQVRQVDADW